MYLGVIETPQLLTPTGVGKVIVYPPVELHVTYELVIVCAPYDDITLGTVPNVILAAI